MGTTSEELDAADRAILSCLRQNSRISDAALGRAVSLSTSAAKARREKLVDRGVIEAFTISVSESASRFVSFEYIILDITAFNSDTEEKIREIVKNDARFLFCDFVKGAIDYVFFVGCYSADCSKELISKIRREVGSCKIQTCPRVEAVKEYILSVDDIF